MGWLETKAIFAFSVVFWCLICVSDGVEESQEVEQVIERSQNLQFGLEDIEPIAKLRNIYSDNDEPVKRKIIFHHRQKRGGSSSKGKGKNSGGGIWKKISRGIQKFKNHIRKTKQNLIRLIKGPTYKKSHGKWKPKSASSSGSSFKVDASLTASIEKGKGKASGI